MSSKTTVRATLSTCVRAVAKITPNASSFAPVTLIAIAARKSRPVALPFADLRLVDEHLPVGKIDDARPWVRGKPGGGRGRRRGGARRAGLRMRDDGGDGNQDGNERRKYEAERERHDSADILEWAAGGQGGDSQ